MFESSVLFTLIVTCVSSQPLVSPRSQTYQGRDTTGTYSFGYTVHEPTGTTKFRQESGDGAGNRQGSYGLEEKDSQRIVFNYATKPKSSAQFVSHPVSLSTQQHHHQQGLSSALPPTPLITPSQLTVSSSPSGPRGVGGGGHMDGSSVDVGFSPSFEPRGHEMDDDSRFNNPAFDDDFDFDGQGKSYGGGGGEPKMRQNSNTHWDGGESMGGNGLSGNRGGGGGSDPGPWNKQIPGSENNEHHHSHHHNPHSPSHSPHHHHNHQHHPRGGSDTFGINESSDIPNEPANYEQLVDYLSNQHRSPGQQRSPMRPEDFVFKSR